MFRTIPLLIPWALLLLIDYLARGNELATEVLLVGSGFLALAFAALSFLLLLGIPGDHSFMLRRFLLLQLLLFPLALLPWVLLPVNLLLLLFWVPKWQKVREETVRLEPIFFLIVGMKVAIVALLLL